MMVLVTDTFYCTIVAFACHFITLHFTRAIRAFTNRSSFTVLGKLIRFVRANRSLCAQNCSSIAYHLGLIQRLCQLKLRRRKIILKHKNKIESLHLLITERSERSFNITRETVLRNEGYYYSHFIKRCSLSQNMS